MYPVVYLFIVDDVKIKQASGGYCVACYLVFIFALNDHRE